MEVDEQEYFRKEIIVRIKKISNLKFLRRLYFLVRLELKEKPKI